ncbi:MAG: mechanosensitive ion channel family protein [Oligoflexia bacterium]|nr:mechanosensitive ion channel family protein [Oligoflexia bacterium]
MMNFLPKDLLMAAGVVAVAWTLTRAVRALLRTVGERYRLPFLAELAVSISNLIYIGALKFLTDLAPLPPAPRRWIESGIYVAFVLMLLGIFRRGILIGIEWSARRSVPSQTLQQGFVPLMRNAVTLFVFLTGGIMILKHFDYDVMSLVTALGVGSLAVGLAAKDTLSNMISGFTLIIDRNLKPGDVINLGGTVGEVDEIGLRSTRIRTGDGNLLIVPNAELVNTKILNLSSPTSEVTCSVQLRVPVSVPFEQIQSICQASLAELSAMRRNRGSSINLSALAEGMQTIQIGFWVANVSEQGAAQSELNQKILARCQELRMPLGVAQ